MSKQYPFCYTVYSVLRLLESLASRVFLVVFSTLDFLLVSAG